MFAGVLPLLYIRVYTFMYILYILLALLASCLYVQDCFIALFCCRFFVLLLLLLVFIHAPALACVLVVLLAVEPSRASSPY